MLRPLSVACYTAILALHVPQLVLSGEWASRVSEVNDNVREPIRAAVAANKHMAAKELIRSRDKKLALILSEFESAPKQELSEEDAIAVIHSYELLWRWERAREIADEFVKRHPAAEAVHMANLRCLLNLNRVEEASQLLSTLEDQFPEHSPVRFVHSMLAPKYQIQKKWQLVLHHSDLAARRRIALVRTHPEIAEWALGDFRRIAEAAIAMQAEDVGTDVLNDLARLLDETLIELAAQEPSDAVFSQECLAHKLRSDIGYWLGGKDAGVPFQQWVRSILRAWESKAVSEPVVRRRASAVLQYLERHGGILTPQMMDALREMRAFAEARLSASPDDPSLVQLSRRCQRAIEGEAFRQRQSPEPFGGISR